MSQVTFWSDCVRSHCSALCHMEAGQLISNNGSSIIYWTESNPLKEPFFLHHFLNEILFTAKTGSVERQKCITPTSGLIGTLWIRSIIWPQLVHIAVNHKLLSSLHDCIVVTSSGLNFIPFLKMIFKVHCANCSRKKSSNFLNKMVHIYYKIDLVELASFHKR